MYFIGNCYCWSLILKMIYGGKIFSINQELGPKGMDVKHYMLRGRDGKVRHFKRVCNILPPPFSAFLFVGKLETSGKKKRSAKASMV
jgi:hypothetical protein